MLREGDKIWVWKSGVRHYGIVAGVCAHGVTQVVHASKSSRRVELAPMREFAAGQPIRVEQHAPIGREHVVVARAMRLIGRAYDLLNFNCEHAANYAMTGAATSDQVRTALTAIGIGAAAVGLVWLATRSA